MSDPVGLAELIADLRELREQYDLDALSAVARLPAGTQVAITVGRLDNLTIEREAPR